MVRQLSRHWGLLVGNRGPLASFNLFSPQCDATLGYIPYRHKADKNRLRMKVRALGEKQTSAHADKAQYTDDLSRDRSAA